MTVPAAREMVPSQRGLLEVYCEAESAMALEVSQFPRAATLPAILMVWPTTVVTLSAKVTATDVAVPQVDVVVLVDVVDVVDFDDVDVVVVVPPLPALGVWFGGQEPVAAVAYVPMADVDEHTDGTLEALGSPQEYGTTPARRAAAVRKAA
jgi:hypothetical protein